MVRVSVWVLSDEDVRAVLDMESCIEAMTDVLSSLARGELHQPLRFVVRPPTDELLGLMPAWRGGSAPGVLAQGDRRLAWELGPRARPAPGRGAPPRRRHRPVAGDPQRERDHRDPHGGGLRGRDPGAGTTGCAATVAILGSGVQGRSHVAAMRAVLPDAELRIWSRTAEHAVGLALAQQRARLSRSVEEALSGADVVCTTTSSREPILRREWLAPGAHVNAVGSSVPSARELDVATVVEASLFVDRRESTVNESGDYLAAVEEAGIDADHIRAELGEVLVGIAPRAHGRRRS